MQQAALDQPGPNPARISVQVFILDSLATYQAVDEKEAERITERVAPRLQHANCAVVLSAVKVPPQAYPARLCMRVCVCM